MNTDTLKETDLIIIGTGPAGLFATFCAGLRDIDTTTLEAMDSVGGQVSQLYPEKTVYDVQGIPEINASDLVKQMYRQAKMFNADILVNSKVTDIVRRQDGRFDIEVNGRISYVTRAVLLASGIGSFSPTKLGVPGEEDYFQKGINYSLDDSLDYKGTKTIIVGAGDSAFDFADELSDVAKEVLVVQRSNRVRAAEMTVKKVSSKNNVKIRLNTIITQLQGDGEWISGVTIKDNDTQAESVVNTDRILVAIGHKSSPVSFKSMQLEMTGKYVKVNERFETSVQGIYAVGDCSSFGESTKVLLIAVGGGEAYMAVNNIKKYLDPKASLFGGHSSSISQ